MSDALQAYKDAIVDDGIVHIQEATKNDGDYTTPYPIGYDIFDEAMKGGAREGDLVIITGLSGHGKTTLAQNISVNYSKRKQPCLWFSYEVIVDNLYAKFKDMGATEKNFFIYTPKQTTSGGIDWIEKKVLEGLTKENTKFVFIDHIDFLSPRNIKGSDQRRIMLRDICQELKRIAIDHKVAIFLIAHVKKVQGREVEMQDIAESSGIYQLADFVFAVTRKFDIKVDNSVTGKRKVEMISDQSEVRMLKNRITGEQPIMNFILKDNIIRPLGDDGILSSPIPEDDDEEELSFDEINKLF